MKGEGVMAAGRSAWAMPADAPDPGTLSNAPRGVTWLASAVG